MQTFTLFIILRVFISFTKQIFTFHSNRVNVKNKFRPRWDSNPRPPAFAASVLPLDHRGPHGSFYYTSLTLYYTSRTVLYSPMYDIGINDNERYPRWSILTSIKSLIYLK